MTHRNQSLGDHTHSCAFRLLQHSIAPLVAVVDRQLSPFLHWSQSRVNHSTQLNLPVCLPKIRVHLHPLAPSVIFIPALSSHPCLLSSHLCLNVCSPPQISGFYRVPPCIQKCLHNAPVMVQAQAWQAGQEGAPVCDTPFLNKWLSLSLTF